MRTDIGKMFGDLQFDIYWSRPYKVRFLGKERDVELVVDGDEDSDFEPAQHAAFAEFERLLPELMGDVENELLTHYVERRVELCARYSDRADEVCPFIDDARELDQLLILKQVIVLESFGSDERQIGLVLDAVFEPELGIGIRIVNGRVSQIAEQDIVL